MSDRPVEPQLPPAGWYPDPAQTGKERWWDGTAWSEMLRPPAPTYGNANSPYPGYGYVPPRKSRKPLWITLGVVGGLFALVLTLAIVFIVQNRGSAKHVVSSYLTDLMNRDYPAAYQLLCPADQDQLTESQFARDKSSLRPLSFDITGIKLHAGMPDTAKVYYEVVDSAGEQGSEEIPARKSGKTWQVCHAVEPGSWIGVN